MVMPIKGVAIFYLRLVHLNILYNKMYAHASIILMHTQCLFG